MNIYPTKQRQMKYRPLARLKQLGVCVEEGGGGGGWGGESEQIGGTKLPLSPVSRKKKIDLGIKSHFKMQPENVKNLISKTITLHLHQILW